MSSDINLKNEFENLSKAPLTEVVLEVRFSKLDSKIFEKIISFSEEFRPFFPKKEIRNERTVSLNLNQVSSLDMKDLGPTLIYLRSADDTKILQIGTNQLVYSEIKTYSGWQNFSSVGWSYFNRIFKEANIGDLTMIAARYINKIALPKAINFDDYFTIGPRVPKFIPDVVGGFNHLSVLVNEAEDLIANLIYKFKFNSDLNEAPIFLDINVFYPKIIKVVAPDIDAILGKIRIYKNQIFFGSITDKLKEILK
jgi:uncharacterized protein (TIGR04255 family)